jgi:signal transduction histidine kinase/CheY-like chemotaxis protein
VSKSEVDDLHAGRLAHVRSDIFGVADGMPSAECHGGSQPAGTRTSDGRLWFPTLKGLAVLDPAQLRVNTVPPPVALEEVRVDRQPTDLRAQPTVPPGQRDFEFQYTALSFLAPDRIRFQYQLEGLDPRWVEAGNRRVAYYSRLPPGRYRFHVRAANSDGTWNEEGADVPFYVQPRLIERRSFQAVLLALGVCGVLVSHRLRTRHLRLRQQELEALVSLRTRDLREAQAQEEAARRRAEDASRAKTRFLANISHELRTPLTAILGFVEVMERRGGRDVEDREHLEIVQRSGEHLLSLINEVLSISQIEAGRMPLREATFDLPHLLRGLRELFGPRAAARGLSLELPASPGQPRWVRGDAGKLRQILINLLGNAIKFTPSGAVTVRASWHEGMADFEIDDTGPGISEEDQARLFTPFAQGETSVAQEGTGLGLAISRSYARLMGGDLALRSAPGLGSVFRLSVPLPESEAPAVSTGDAGGEDTPPPRLERPFRILVVDDTAENRLLMARIHGLAGLDVRQAVDGVEALELWQSLRPDLIWMDTQMPRMDGPTATREIRRLEKDQAAGEHVPIIAVTAGVLDAEERALLEAGYDAVVPKPFRSKTILDMLQKYLAPPPER